MPVFNSGGFVYTQRSLVPLKTIVAITCFITFSITGILLFQYCNNTNNRSSVNYKNDTSIQIGKTLAVQFCQSCHLFPDPSLLDKKSWRNGVLPGMGPRLGILEFNGQYYTSSKDYNNIPPDYYPKEPLLTQLQWQHIIEYYLATAPDSLPKANRAEKMISGLPHFTLQIPKRKFSLPSTCYISIDTTNADKRIFFADANSQSLYVYNKDLVPVDSIHTKGAVVDIVFDKSRLIACNMGFMNPGNDKLGFLQIFSRISANHGLYGNEEKKFTGLARPVQVNYVDLNQDRRKDYLICEFGNLTGALIWMEQMANGSFTRHVLREAPGAIKSIVTDYNHDGLPDILSLFTQAQEGIVLYTNKGKGKFEEKQLMRFPPVYGSSSFELDDFNMDGYQDILYTCGDNADYSPIVKPYHGIYIFLNDGKYHFTQEYFFPLSGCFKAMARDFDGDGNLDIASIAFFTDPTEKEKGFVYLHNKGGLLFQPYTFPEAASGHWLTMDVNDLDGDGKPDIILGNFNFSTQENNDSLHINNSSFLLLKNR
ncbi:MAG: VCBS repeat-containing protein [Ferruginibacter sp.]